MEFITSSTAALLPIGFKLSECSWWIFLTSRENGIIGLTLLCLCWSSGASLSCCGYCISAYSCSSLTASTCLPLTLFLGPLVIVVSVNGEVLG